MEKTSKYYIATNKLFSIEKQYENTLPTTDQEWRDFETAIERHWLSGTEFERDLIMAFLQEKKREWEQQYGNR